jgi:hypothetical protein
MFIIKRNGIKQEFDPTKIDKAILAATNSTSCTIPNTTPSQYISVNDGDSVETIQDRIET